jgi:hypothetical protein
MKRRRRREKRRERRFSRCRAGGVEYFSWFEVCKHQ